MRRIGTVARAAGMTVRTLRHYDEIGLLVPSGRTEGGYRLYSDADVRRLYRIVALRRLGFALGDVAAVLDRDGDDPRPLVRAQIDRLDEQIEASRRLREDLRALLGALDRDDAPAEQFLHAIEGMRMIDRYYTPEQLEQLARRRQELGDEAIERAQQEWADLIARAQAERERGTDPGDPRVQAIVARWDELIEAFTGGDPGIRASLQRMYEQEGTAAASRGMVDPGLMEWVGRARAQKR
jgi:MerR family transcriptional regulator, thiopeptide resistance regulator